MDVKLISFSVILAILAIAIGSIGIDCVRKNNDGKQRKNRLTFLGLMVAAAILVVGVAIFMSRKKIMSTVAKAGARAGARAGAVAGANAGAVTGAVSGATGAPVAPVAPVVA